jgi:hypothetical protein
MPPDERTYPRFFGMLVAQYVPSMMGLQGSSATAAVMAIQPT